MLTFAYSVLSYACVMSVPVTLHLIAGWHSGARPKEQNLIRVLFFFLIHRSSCYCERCNMTSYLIYKIFRYEPNVASFCLCGGENDSTPINSAAGSIGSFSPQVVLLPVVVEEQGPRPQPFSWCNPNRRDEDWDKRAPPAATVCPHYCVQVHR